MGVTMAAGNRDGTDLAVKQRRRTRRRAMALTLPLIAFIGVTFIAPLGMMLVNSVYDPVVADAMPDTLAQLQNWDGRQLPSAATFEAATRELVAAREIRRIGQLATRVNRIESGLRSVITRSSRTLARVVETAPEATAGTDFWRTAMLEANDAWGDPTIWRAIRRAGQRVTPRHYLQALDLQQDASGDVVLREPNQRVYLVLLGRTLLVSFGVTALCLLLGYPVAYLIAQATPQRANLLLLLVLVPFWTSLLVRTTSWIVLLQSQGVINDVLVTLGLLAEDGRLAMIYNMTGTFVAMTHVLLPFMVLPLYAVMRTIPATHMSAAASLGASFPRAFRRVYWPQTLAGVGAGSLLVFILAIGYYITPALVGGRTGQMISNMIAYHMQQSLNWGLAAALGGVLLAGVGVLYFLYDRLIGVERMKLG